MEDTAGSVFIMFQKVNDRICCDDRTMHRYMDNVTATSILSHSLDVQGLSHTSSSRSNYKCTVSAAIQSVWRDVYNTCKEKRLYNAHIIMRIFVNNLFMYESKPKLL